MKTIQYMQVTSSGNLNKITIDMHNTYASDFELHLWSQHTDAAGKFLDFNDPRIASHILWPEDHQYDESSPMAYMRIEDTLAKIYDCGDIKLHDIGLVIDETPDQILDQELCTVELYGVTQPLTLRKILTDLGISYDPTTSL